MDPHPISANGLWEISPQPTFQLGADRIRHKLVGTDLLLWRECKCGIDWAQSFLIWKALGSWNIDHSSVSVMSSKFFLNLPVMLVEILQSKDQRSHMSSFFRRRLFPGGHWDRTFYSRLLATALDQSDTGKNGCSPTFFIGSFIQSRLGTVPWPFFNNVIGGILRWTISCRELHRDSEQVLQVFTGIFLYLCFLFIFFDWLFLLQNGQISPFLSQWFFGMNFQQRDSKSDSRSYCLAKEKLILFSRIISFLIFSTSTIGWVSRFWSFFNLDMRWFPQFSVINQGKTGYGTFFLLSPDSFFPRGSSKLIWIKILGQLQ